MKKLSRGIFVLTIISILIGFSTIAQAMVVAINCDECNSWSCVNELQKKFFTTGRWGYNETPARTWEQAIWNGYESKPSAEGQFIWPSDAVPFSVSYSPSDGLVTYILGKETLTWKYDADTVFDYIIPFAKGNSDGNNVELTGLVLQTDYYRPICDIITANDYRGVKVPMSAKEQTKGFTISGKVKLIVNKQLHKDEIPGFHILVMNAPPPPTLINLSSFDAQAGSSSVTLSWTTESEIDNAGFNLYRVETPDGEYVQINGALIPAEGSPSQGAAYSFIDTGVKNRNVYYYKLEDIDLNGSGTLHGPVSATPRWIYGIR